MDEKKVDTSILSDDQRRAWDALSEGKNLFITARAGAGKSFLIDFIRKNYRGRILVTASTGIAANNVGGRTLHSQFLINPMDMDAKESADKCDAGKRGHAMRSARLLIIDEISMVSDRLLECVSSILQQVRMSTMPFGGLQVAFFGDFLQLPPVFKGDSKDDHICWDCACWKEAKIETQLMTCNFRQKEDKEFQGLLTRLRYNKMSQKDYDRIRSRNDVPDDTAIRIFSTNREVDEYNKVRYQKLDPMTEHAYVASGWGEQSLLTAYWKDSLIPEILELRLGVRVMMCKNVDTDEGYLFNGSLGEVVGFTGNGNFGDPIVKFDCGITYTVERQTIYEAKEKNERGYEETLASIDQHPLRVAYACTVHKMQGVTVDSAFIDCSRMFMHGQLYVAISRCRSLEGLFIVGFNPRAKASFSEPELVSKYIDMEQEAFERANPD